MREGVLQMSNPNPTIDKSKELVIIRTFDAPREFVWNAWTNPKAFKKWWGPKGFSCPYCEIDLRVGGKYHNCMQSADEKKYWATGTYKQIIPNEKLVCTDSFSDPDGNIVSASHYGLSDDFPRELQLTVLLDQINSKTRMTLKHEGMPDGEMQENARIGWNESFDKLANSLKVPK